MKFLKNIGGFINKIMDDTSTITPNIAPEIVWSHYNSSLFNREKTKNYTPDFRYENTLLSKRYYQLSGVYRPDRFKYKNDNKPVHIVDLMYTDNVNLSDLRLIDSSEKLPVNSLELVKKSILEIITKNKNNKYFGYKDFEIDIVYPNFCVSFYIFYGEISKDMFNFVTSINAQYNDQYPKNHIEVEYENISKYYDGWLIDEVTDYDKTCRKHNVKVYIKDTSNLHNGVDFKETLGSTSYGEIRDLYNLNIVNFMDKYVDDLSHNSVIKPVLSNPEIMTKITYRYKKEHSPRYSGFNTSYEITILLLPLDLYNNLKQTLNNVYRITL